MLRHIKNLFHAGNATIASVWYQHPAEKLIVIGVTGTSGKTTTSHLLYSILKTAKKKVSLISTVEAKINGKSYDTGFHVTTPSPWKLQQFLREAVFGGTEYLVLEVTSHALDQFRTLGVPIRIGIITNIDYEHLDYHKTLEKYRSAKAKILKDASVAVLNSDDPNFSSLARKAKGKIITFGIEKKADYNPFFLGSLRTSLKKYHLGNSLAAIAVSEYLGIKKSKILEGLKFFKGVAGRMEEVRSKRKFRIFIDFAHKPNALEFALSTLRKETKGKLIAVFGAAGLRDRLKRPVMGEIAGRYADFIVLTAEDPRTEKISDIINEIAEGCFRIGVKKSIENVDVDAIRKKNNKYLWKITDRTKAIDYAINHLARDGDIVIIMGKGHEKSMCFGTVEHPWNEFITVQKVLHGPIK